LTIQVVIAEDEGLFRDMPTRALSAHPNISVMHSVGDGESAVKVAREMHPDVVLMDIEMGTGLNGIEAGRLIKEEHPEIGIVILSSHRDKEYVTAMPLERAEGWCYTLKQSVSDVESLTRALEGAASGLMVLDPQLVESLRPGASGQLEGLTPRQWEVLQLIAKGFSNSAIAERLVLSEKSVENYINAVYQQLQITRGDRIHPRVKAVLVYLQQTTET
jgi:DNA-binding NarL/FixJ family response regulator